MGMKAFDRILVPTDSSAGAEAAGAVAGQLARRLEASVDVVTVVDTSTFEEIYGDAEYRKQRAVEIYGQAQKDARAFADRHFRDSDRVAVHVRDGNTFLELMQAVRDLGTDMIVMGTHGRTGLAHLVIGSIAEKVVRASTVPVVTVRAPE
jgi:nucleotide-binding universal stress UspA family protein